jgi:hypothetical protein
VTAVRLAELAAEELRAREAPRAGDGVDLLVPARRVEKVSPAAVEALLANALADAYSFPLEEWVQASERDVVRPGDRRWS